MATYLVHYVANHVGQDYQKMERALQVMKAVQLTEELWLIDDISDMQDMTQDLFADRPSSDRFLVMEMSSASAWMAANLMSDPRDAFSNVSQRYIPVPRMPSVKIFHPDRPPQDLSPDLDA